jgi:hypothetical protein
MDEEVEPSHSSTNASCFWRRTERTHPCMRTRDWGEGGDGAESSAFFTVMVGIGGAEEKWRRAAEARKVAARGMAAG